MVQESIVKIKDIKIGERFRKKFNEKETQELMRSIQEVGLLTPIIVDENNQLLDGGRRIQAFIQLGYEEIPITTINLKNILRERAEVHANFREDWKCREKVAIASALLPLEKLEAKQRQGYESSSEKFSEVKKGEALVKIATILNESRPTLEKRIVIVEASRRYPTFFGDLPEQVDNGKSVDQAYKMVIRFTEHKEPPEIPTGEYDIILADPPWSYEINTRGAPDEHYAVMTDKEIQKLKIPAAENAILFLWATGPKLPQALTVINAWNFEYKTSAVWVKDKIGTGYYFRGQHELLLVAERGDMPVPQEKDRFSSVINAPRKQHSEKPDIVYEIIERMYPNRSYLELFARKPRAGWESWGAEVVQS